MKKNALQKDPDYLNKDLILMSLRIFVNAIH